MNIEEIRHLGAIDIHSHLGYAHEPESDPLRDGSVQCLLKNMEASQIRLSVNSSWYALSPQGSGYTVEGNRQCLEEAENNADIYMWVTIDPHQPESFAQAQDYLKHEKVLGIKIHPQLHDYDLLKEGDKLFSFAAKQGVPILGHSGIEHMLPMEYCILADRYPEIPVIAAHLGCGGDHLLQMRALEQNWSGNLYVDTSSSMSILTNLVEYTVSHVGADHLLFGTDSPSYFSPCQRIRINEAFISNEDKFKILRGNALKLFPVLNNALKSS